MSQRKPSASDGKLNNRRPDLRASFYVLLSLTCLACLIWYVKNAADDVVYSDYMRIILSYIPNTLEPSRFFVPDILTRIPITYLVRAINQAFFHYSVTVDRVLGVLGLWLVSVIILKYTKREHYSMISVVGLMLIALSLNKWEMLINGTGYAHFLAFAMFYWHFLILERLYTGTGKKYDLTLCYLLPWLSLLVAGPYIAIYIVVLLIAYIFMWLSENKNVKQSVYKMLLPSTLVPLLLYFISNHYAEYDYVGAQDVTLFETLTGYKAFSVHFILNGFASQIIGGEEIEQLLGSGQLNYTGIYLLGILGVASVVLAVYLYIKLKIYKETVFPALLLLHGLGSQCIVFLSRYIFLKETYAWQSRYALQYQSTVLGVILIFLYAFRVQDRWKNKVWKAVALLLTLTFILGNCYTTFCEIQKMPYREARFRQIEEAAYNYDSLSDEELQNLFEYRKGGDKIREALTILKDHDLNIYYQGGESTYQ